MMSDNEDDYSNEYSLDVPTDEEEEDVRHYHEYASYDPDAVGLQEQPRMTPPSVLLLPNMTPPSTNNMMMTPTHTPPPRSPRTRRFTSLPLHLEESLARATTLTRARTTSAVTHSPAHANDTMYSPFSGISMSDLHQQPPSPRPRRAAGCSRVLLVLVAYVGLMVFPRPPLLHFRTLSSPTPVIPIPKFENEFLLVEPLLIENTAPQPKEQKILPEQQQQQVEQQQLSSPQEQQQQSKRRVRQPTLAHARTNRRSTIFYGGKPDASLLFLDHIEEPPLQQRQLPRFFFSTGRTVDATSQGRRSFFKKETPENANNDDQQQQQHWLWWILYKVAWLVLLGCTLEAGVREIPRRFHTWTGLWPGPTHSRIHSSSASYRHGMALLSSSSSPPPPLSRAFSTPRRRRG